MKNSIKTQFPSTLKYLTIAITGASLFLVGCSSKEDKLWENRLADLNSTAIATVASVNLQISDLLSSEDSLKITAEAHRDLNIYLHGKTNIKSIDTTTFINDSIIPQITWQKLAPYMVSFFVNKPYEKSTDNWTLAEGRTKSKALLQTLIIKSEEFYQEPQNPLKEILSTYTTQENEVKIPVWAFLVQSHKDYAWIICSKWNLALNESDNKSAVVDHFEGIAYSVKTKKELGRFYHQPKPQISDSLATITEQQEPLHNLVLE